MLAIILITSPVGATIYYVSNTGNDSNAGTSESQAWRSLDKVNSFIPSPGDQVLFKRGGSWIGSITVNASGNSGNPITYGAYGSGEKPAIYGSELISGWSKFSGNIYRASCSSDVTQVFVDGTRMNVARYPNSGYIDITSVATATQFTASNLPSQSSDYYKNAKVHIRSKDWRLETKDVTASSAQSISFDSGLIFALTKGQKFFLNNKLEFLDLPGEWFYDSTTKTVYLWLQSGDSPENHVVRGSTISSGFEMYNRDYITVKDISLLHFKSHAVKTDKCDYLTIDNNTITYCEGSAVYFYPNYVNGINIRNNTIHHIGQTAVMGRCTSSTLSNNQISEVSLFGEIGIAGLGTGNGFSIDGNNNKVQDNRISNVGYNGISFKGENTVVEFNYINSACNTLTDGGGIYTYTGQDISKPGSAGSIIRNNLVLNCMGEYEESSGKYSCNGIYLDEGTHDVTVENNTVAKAGYAAVFFNITSNNILRNNTVFDAPILFLYVKQYLPSSLQNNIFVTANRNGTTAWWKNSHQRIIFQLLGAEGKYDYHTYVSHYNNTSIFDSNGDGQFEPFEKWNSVTGQDVNSTVDCSVLKEGENEVLFYNDTKQVKTINLGSYTYKDVCGKLITGTFTLEPFTSKILVKTNTVSNQNPVINNQSFEIKGSKSANSFIGTVSANDPDEGQTLTYSITQGNESDIFTINESTGEILTNKDIALTKDISYALSVEVTDNAVAPMSATAIVTINFKYIETTFAEYLFEETSGTIVYDSNNKNNGNIINENLKADGANGKGLEFTGSGYITLGQSFSDNVSNEVSLSAWIKPNLSSAGYQGIIMHGGVNTDTYGLYIFPDSKTVGFKTTGTSNAWSSISNVNKLWDGQWHQLTVTYNGTEKIIYLDGEVLITIPSEGNIESGAGYNLLVGAGRDGVAPSLLYKGIIDEARIYNYALTPEQASALYSPVEVVPETVYGSEEITICEGDSYNGWTREGEYKRTLTALNGADSIVTTYLTVNPTYTITEEKTIKEGENYLGWTKTGEYQRTLATIYGCDSIVTTNLTVLKSVTTYEDVNICQGESYMGWTTTGVYQRVLEAANGADSLVITNLGVNPVYNITEEITITEGENYLGWTVSGTYQRNLTSISGCDSTVVTILNVTPNLKISEDHIGNTEIYAYTAKDNNLRAMPVTFAQNAIVNSITIYHEGGSGNMILGTYADQSGTPSSILGAQSAKVNATEGWQTVMLSTPVNVKAGQTVWLAWIFQKNPGVRYFMGTPGRASSKNTWQTEMPENFGKSNISNYKYSIYCSFTFEENTIEDIIGNTDVFSYVAKDDNLRAMPVTFSRKGIVNSISIYHGGGFGNMILGMYADQSGSPSTKLGVSRSTPVNANEGWQTVELSTPICVTAGQTVWLAWIFQNNPGVRYSIGAPGRASSQNTWQTEMPENFGISNTKDYKYSVYCTYITNSYDFKDATVPETVSSIQEEKINSLKITKTESILSNDIFDIDFMLYPNPASSMVNIDFTNLPNTDTRLLIIDNNGRIVVDRNVGSLLNQFDISQFPSGMYFIKTINKDKTNTKKLIIKR
ncbi:MAG: LamG-like jellyroll fold domain-containing protein [Draconibacterium sp.]